MQIFYEGESCDGKLTIVLNSKEYRVKWGRGWSENGPPPRCLSLDHELLQAGLLEGFKTQYVPILADEYHVSSDGPHVREKVKKGYYISGILVKLLDETRVYVVTISVKDDAGAYMLPKVERFPKSSMIGGSGHSV